VKAILYIFFRKPLVQVGRHCEWDERWMILEGNYRLPSNIKLHRHISRPTTDAMQFLESFCSSARSVAIYICLPVICLHRFVFAPNTTFRETDYKDPRCLKVSTFKTCEVSRIIWEKILAPNSARSINNRCSLE
jgi:hypothetical protein